MYVVRVRFRARVLRIFVRVSCDRCTLVSSWYVVGFPIERPADDQHNDLRTWYIFLSPQSSRSSTTIGLVLMYIGLGLCASLVYLFFIQRENSARDRGERDEIMGDEPSEGKNEKNGRFATLEEAKREKGDEWSGYRYTL